MLIGRHPEADDPGRVDVDDHALQHGDVLVAGQRVLPRLERRVTDLRPHEVHVADVPLVLLKGCDLFRVGRPDQDGPVALRPAGVVGRVAEILHAISGQRPLRAGRDVADPQVPVLDVGRARTIGRLDVSGRRRRVGPARAASARATPARALRERAGDVRPGCRIHQHGLRALRGRDPVPDLVVGQPRRLHRRVVDQRRRVGSQKFLRARIIRRRQRPRGIDGVLPRHERRHTQRNDGQEHEPTHVTSLRSQYATGRGTRRARGTRGAANTGRGARGTRGTRTPNQTTNFEPRTTNLTQ